MGNPVIETCRYPDQSFRQWLIDNSSNLSPCGNDTKRGHAGKLNDWISAMTGCNHQFLVAGRILDTHNQPARICKAKPKASL